MNQGKMICGHGSGMVSNSERPAAMQHYIYSSTAIMMAADRFEDRIRENLSGSTLPLISCYEDGGFLRVDMWDACEFLRNEWVPREFDPRFIAVMIKLILGPIGRLYSNEEGRGANYDVRSVAEYRHAAILAEAMAPFFGPKEDRPAITDSAEPMEESLQSMYKRLSKIPMLPPLRGHLGEELKRDHRVWWGHYSDGWLHSNGWTGDIKETIDAAVESSHPKAGLILSEFERLANLRSEVSEALRGDTDGLEWLIDLRWLEDAVSSSPHCIIEESDSERRLRLRRIDSG
jgi:hypothetical protein